MKILVVSPTGSLDNGAEVSIINLMTLLSQQGHQVFNVFPRTTNPTVGAYLERLEQAKVRPFSLETYQWWWEEAPAVGTFDSELTKIYYYRNINTIREIIREEQIELVISNTVNVFLGALAAACEGVRHFWLIHEFPYGEFAYYKEKLPFVIAHSDKIFAVEGELFNELVNWIPKEKLGSFVPYSELSVSQLNEGEENRLVSVGRLTERKNQLELLVAYEKLGRFDVPLVFIGGWDEEYKAKCDQFIQDHSLSNVHFLGHHPQPWTQVKSKDVLAFSSSLEAFPLVLIEALLTGQPVVFSDNPGHLTIARKFELMTGQYSLGDVPQLAELIGQVLDDFDTNYLSSQSTAIRVKDDYVLEKSYSAILEALSGQATPSSLAAVSSLLNLKLPDRALPFLQDQVVKIYLSDEQGIFSEDRIVITALQEEDAIVFSPKGAKKIRVDLSELPSVYARVTLLDGVTGQVIEPKSSNGLSYKEGYCFLLSDPQLLYDVSNCLSEKLVLNYLAEEPSHNRFSTELSHVLAERESLRQALVQTLKERDEIEGRYHAVIGSRRWTIPTNIINFLRRKK